MRVDELEQLKLTAVAKLVLLVSMFGGLRASMLGITTQGRVGAIYDFALSNVAILPRFTSVRRDSVFLVFS